MDLAQVEQMKGLGEKISADSWRQVADVSVNLHVIRHDDVKCIIIR